jgi:hypothetical protein
LAARLQELSVDELWLVGICGGIDSTLQSGDLVIVVDKQEQREFQDGPLSPLRQLDHGELSFIGLETLHGTKFRGRIFEGTGVCSAGILSRAEKLELAQTGSAGIVEMESSAWRTWSTAKQIPMFHLRVVCDPVNQEPPKPRIGRPTPNVLTGPEASESRREKFGQGLRDLWTAAKSLRQLGACLSAESAKKN